jgi:BCD family chlorophyll transporter-like MFS transporter
MNTAPLSWLGIVRLGLVQTALGAVIVLMTSTINRVMIVELALVATLPGMLVALHYAVQMLRPRMGYGSDVGGRRTPWIIGGMAVLALGGTLAAAATGVMHQSAAGGIALAVVAFILIGLGVGAAGTSLLALLAARTAPARRPAAATIVWIMMIAGFVVTAASAGRVLDPYSPERLLAVTAAICAIAFIVACLAVAGIEPRARVARAAARPRGDFRTVLLGVWAEPAARRFAVFVFVSMLAYSAQDLILEPFAGLVFGMTLGESTRASAVQHGGVLAGMIVVGVIGTALGRGSLGVLRGFSVGGCVLAALSLVGIAVAGMAGAAFAIRPGFFVLGLGNGIFAAAAIATMMQLAGREGEDRAGTRLGLWGAAQAIAFGLGGLAGAAAVDVAGLVLQNAAQAYAAVFLIDAVLFVASARLAARVTRPAETAPRMLPRGAAMAGS